MVYGGTGLEDPYAEFYLHWQGDWKRAGLLRIQYQSQPS
jgi:hypothetical protein